MSTPVMSTTPVYGGPRAVPTLTVGWRLQMALGHNGMSAVEMADALGVNRGTVSRWMHDRGAAPRRAYLRQWAALTGVDPTWLEDGGCGCAAKGADTEAYTHLFTRGPLFFGCDNAS